MRSIPSVMDGLIRELRWAGIPISSTEKLDALRVISGTTWDSPERLRGLLSATLVKDSAHLESFDVVFDIFVSASSEDTQEDSARQIWSDLTDDRLRELVLRALRHDDTGLLRILAGEAVRRWSDFSPGRPVGGVYYVMRTLRALGADNLESTLNDEIEAEVEAGRRARLQATVAHAQVPATIDALRAEVDSHVRDLLVADQSAAYVAALRRRPLPEDVAIINASASELAELERVIGPLAQKLSARLRVERRRRHRGRLDVRRTFRSSLATSGVPWHLRLKRAQPPRPQLVVVADVSASVASFAVFTLHLLYQLTEQFSQLRTFIFVDDLREVTGILREARDLTSASTHINDIIENSRGDGHSDYGRILEQLENDQLADFSGRTTLIILGDARNNYRPVRAESLRRVGQVVYEIHWLNPEPRSSWEAGDSEAGHYARACTQMVECRTLRDLEEFINQLA